MTFDKFEQYKIESTPSYGVQYQYKFPNNYGASIIQSEYSYGGSQGLWELAVLRFFKDGTSTLCYDTPITSDVIGNQKEEEIKELLDKIFVLKWGKTELTATLYTTTDDFIRYRLKNGLNELIENEK